MIEGLPEAPASANFVFDLRTRAVTSIQFTLRDSSEQALVDRIGQFMKYIKANKTEEPEAPPSLGEQIASGLPVQPVAPPAPVAQPVQRTGIPVTGDATTEVWEAPDIEVKITPSGIRTLNVRGGAWRKFGATAWPENVPFKEWETWPTKQTFSLPAPYTIAVVTMKTNDKGKLVPDRVLRFE